jgi:hypothetical protein
MPASELPPVGERMASWAAAGGLTGGFLGMVAAGYGKPAVGEASMAYVGRLSATSAAQLAGIAAVFAVTDSVLTSSRGHSALNSATAGCLAGALLGVREGSIQRAAIGCAVFGSIQAAGALGNSGDH